jgi:hypothetical protein
MKVGDVISHIDNELDKATNDINKKLSSLSNEELIVAEKGYIVKNKFWDKWIQKLFAQLISVKVWGLVIITTLIYFGLITGSEFIIGFSLIVGTKGGKDIVMKLVDKKNGSSESDIIDRV